MAYAYLQDHKCQHVPESCGCVWAQSCKEQSCAAPAPQAFLPLLLSPVCSVSHGTSSVTASVTAVLGVQLLLKETGKRNETKIHALLKFC